MVPRDQARPLSTLREPMTSAVFNCVPHRPPAVSPKTGVGRTFAKSKLNHKQTFETNSNLGTIHKTGLPLFKNVTAHSMWGQEI